jgi:hypothetical protein
VGVLGEISKYFSEKKLFMDYGQMKVLVREGGTANETPYKLLKSFSS